MQQKLRPYVAFTARQMLYTNSNASLFETQLKNFAASLLVLYSRLLLLPILFFCMYNLKKLYYGKQNVFFHDGLK